jgi:hypothetical protein
MLLCSTKFNAGERKRTFSLLGTDVIQEPGLAIEDKKRIWKKRCISYTGIEPYQSRRYTMLRIH